LGDLKEGKGEQEYKESDEKYIGEWRENEREGYGKYYYMNQDRYEGQFVMNMR